METLYRKVFINGGENYPEKTGQYWSGRNSLEKEMDLRDFNPDMDDNDFVWGNLDWFLRPIESPELTDAEIEKWMVNMDIGQFDSFWDACLYGAKFVRDWYKDKLNKK